VHAASEQGRNRAREKARKLNRPPHERAPGTLKALKEANEQQAKKRSE